ncbi:hypothetical protein ACQSED_26540 [Salmonella enterica]|uniref:hypothetical protein n=1 Tax=Salmonella enterica TaxID=28901 RepID=UPI003D31333E
MPYHKNKESKVIFSGQNSHGSSESWLYRCNYLSQIPKDQRVAIVIECPTLDLIIYLLRRMNDKVNINYSFLSSSTYWWMRTIEFSNFLRSIPNSFAIYGIDVALDILQYNKHINHLKLFDFPEKEVLLSLMEYDLHSGKKMSRISTMTRELLMKDKLSLVMKNKYDLIFVICHNFHASKKSWLHYPSLCQLFNDEFSNSCDSNSVAILSNKMYFIATNNNHTLSINKVDNICKKIDNNNFLVKMISSIYRSEEEDVLNIVINIPKHFDEIIIFPEGDTITLMESLL